MFFDSHVHLDDPRFEGEVGAVLDRARQARVTAMVNAGSDLASSRRGVELARQYPGRVYAAVGIHPHEAKTFGPASLRELTRLLAEPGTVAVGEIGLDYHYDLSPRDVQKRVMREQLDLAASEGFPVIIHSREAARDTMDILAAYTGRLSGVMHCFSGSWETACELLNRGFYLGFDGPVTFKNAERICAVAAKVPLNRLLIETDCPYLSPEPFRGRRNEPAYVVNVARRLAELKGISVEELAAVTANNAQALFRINPEP